MKAFLIVVAVFIVGWEVAWWLAGVRPILPQSLRRLLKAGQESPILVDVRTAPEYNWFHIQGAKNTPALLNDPGSLQGVDPEKPIVVICMSGHRAPVAAYRLKRLGFKRVSYLSWGMMSWVLSGGPTVKGSGT